MKMLTRLMIAVLIAITTLPVIATSRDCDVVFTPTVLVMKSPAPGLVTLHANVPLLAVQDLDSICLKIGDATLSPEKVFADLCGDLVAKFDNAAVKEAVKNLLTLAKKQKMVKVDFILAVDGDEFYGSFIVKLK